MSDDLLKELQQLNDNLSSIKKNYESSWQDTAKYFLPTKTDITTQKTAGDNKDIFQLFDSTTVVSLDNFANILNGTLTNKSSPWFKVSVQTPSITSISGTIYSGNTSTLTISGTNFGLTNANVTFSGANTASVTGLTPTSSGQILSVTVPSAIYTIAAGSSVGVTVTNSDGAMSGGYIMIVAGLPTGGTISNSGNTRIHTFTSSGSLVVPTGFTTTASYLIVGGGGAGVHRAGSARSGDRRYRGGADADCHAVRILGLGLHTEPRLAVRADLLDRHPGRRRDRRG